jgi:hypothetical protein
MNARLRNLLPLAAFAMSLAVPSRVVAQQSLNDMTVWAISNQAVVSQSATGSAIPTNGIVQFIVSATETGAPPLDFGFAHGVPTNWYVLDTAKVARPGRIVGYAPSGGTNSLWCTVRVLMPAAPYEGNRFTIPNPSVSNGLWMAQTPPRAWQSQFLFHVSQDMWSFVTLDALADTDGDGMTDKVEWRHFNHPTEQSPEGDADKDGLANADELLTQTDPTNSLSYFRVAALPSGETGDGISISWLARTGLVYGVDASPGFSDGEWAFTAILSNIAVAAPGVYATNLPGLDPSAVYRLVATPPTP